MLRRAVILSVTLATAVLAFVGTSFAFGRGPILELRSNLPAASLPTITLDQSEATEINNIVGEVGSIAGITPASYTQVRVLTKTAVGPLYLIPGTRGTCMFLKSGSVCGDPGGASRFNAIVTLDSSGERLVGGGIADDSVRRIEVVVTGYGVRTFVPVTDGVFSINLAVPGFRPGKAIKFIDH